MMKKTCYLAIPILALGVTANAYAANPFSDVPSGHWAYDSIAKLADQGIIEGYGDTTFGGDKLMTRYEMAQIVAKAMARGANVDRLAAEFADELESLGVRVANLENKADNVKIVGEIRYHYSHARTETTNTYRERFEKNKGFENKLRSRITIQGQINDDWTYTGMLQNVQNFANNKGDEQTRLKRAYVNGKIGGAAIQAGRYNAKLADGNVYDDPFDGVQVSYGKDVKIVAGAGKATATYNSHINSFTESYKDTAYYAELSGKMRKLGLNAGYYRFNFEDVVREGLNGSVDKNLTIWTVGASYAFDKSIKFDAMYLRGDDLDRGFDRDGYALTLKYKGAKASAPHSWGLQFKYNNQGTATYVDHTSEGSANQQHGFKGYSLETSYAFAKNIVGKVTYYDYESKEFSGNTAKTLWSQVTFTF